MLNVYIANLGKYNEGYLVGKWVELPCDDIEEELKSIGVEDGTEYEEHAIHDYETDLPIKVSEYSSISALNELAQKLEDMEEDEMNKVLAYMEIHGEEYFDEALENVDDMYLYKGIEDYDDLGRMYLEEVDGLPKEYRWIMDYFDFEAYGRNMDNDNSGGFTEYGYLDVRF